MAADACRFVQQLHMLADSGNSCKRWQILAKVDIPLPDCQHFSDDLWSGG
jgi:hypothetical protein